MYKIVICLFILCSGIVRGFAADLPVLYITTPDGSAITSKEEWREGCRLRIVLPDGTVYRNRHFRFTISINFCLDAPTESQFQKLPNTSCGYTP